MHQQAVSTCLAGAAFGSLTGAKLAQQFGRKGTLLLDVIPLFLGAFLCATASSLNWIIAGRVIIGTGIGLASGLVPLFISEVRVGVKAAKCTPCSTHSFSPQPHTSAPCTACLH